jgi:hypothetical protein
LESPFYSYHIVDVDTGEFNEKWNCRGITFVGIVFQKLSSTAVISSFHLAQRQEMGGRGDAVHKFGHLLQDDEDEAESLKIPDIVFGEIAHIQSSDGRYLGVLTNYDRDTSEQLETSLIV